MKYFEYDKNTGKVVFYSSHAFRRKRWIRKDRRRIKTDRRIGR
jgi:hypothetical protein